MTVRLSLDNREVLPFEVLDLRTPVYGNVEIINDAGVPQNLDVHLREVTAAAYPGGYEAVPLVSFG